MEEFEPPPPKWTRSNGGQRVTAGRRDPVHRVQLRHSKVQAGLPPRSSTTITACSSDAGPVLDTVRQSVVRAVETSAARGRSLYWWQAPRWRIRKSRRIADQRCLLGADQTVSLFACPAQQAGTGRDLVRTQTTTRGQIALHRFLVAFNLRRDPPSAPAGAVKQLHPLSPRPSCFEDLS